MLDVDDLHVSYGGVVRALQGASLSVPDGGVVTLLGSNGAGKSTLLRAISGTLKLHRGAVEAGSVSWHGNRLAGRDPAAIVRSGVVQVPEGRRVFGRLTVEENLRAGGFGTRDAAARARARSEVQELFPVLGERRNQRASLLSGGEQQMLAIGRALMASPKLLLLDEPSLGLAPMLRPRIAAAIREINGLGTSILLVEQNAAMALRLADTAYVLDVGKVSLSGEASELARTDQVRRLYLGEGAGEGDALAQLTRTDEPHGRLRRWSR